MFIIFISFFFFLLIITKLQHKEKNKLKKRFKESTVRLPKKKTGAINES